MREPSPELIALIEAETAGMRHTDKEGFGMKLLSKAAQEEAQLVRCERGTVTAWFPEVAALPLTSLEKGERERLSALALKGQLDEKGQAKLKALLGDAIPTKRKDAPVAFSDADVEYLRRHGHDPAIVARMHEVSSPADYARIVRESKGSGA